MARDLGGQNEGDLDVLAFVDCSFADHVTAYRACSGAAEVVCAARVDAVHSVRTACRANALLGREWRTDVAYDRSFASPQGRPP